MAGARDIKRRIRAVQNNKKITKAMEMVAAAKLRRAQERALAARPYAAKLTSTLRRLARAQRGSDIRHPLLEAPKTGDVVYCLITSDRGLAGSYNVNLIRHVAARIKEQEGNVALVAVGRKGLDYFRRRNVNILASFTPIGEEARVSLADEVAETLMGLFVEGKAREVRLVYSEFVSAVSQRPKEVQVLPVSAPEEKGARGVAAYDFIPSAEEMMAGLLPKLVKNQLYQGLLEAKASENAARMAAMRAATDNAQKLIGDLTLLYNRVRQAAITTEISEIVGGAEALKG